LFKYNKKCCPYCSNKGVYHFSLVSSHYFKCLNCNLIYKNSRKNYKEVVSNYKNNYYDNFGKTEINGERNKLYLDILKFIEKKIQVGKLLDVGTGCGFFLLFARKRGWAVNGIDPSLKSIKIASKYKKIDVTQCTLKEYKSKHKFDVITFINVLDHSAKPWKEIERAKKLLKPGGHIFIRSPNGFLHSSILKLCSKIGVKNQANKFLVFHEFSFTSSYLKTLFNDYGFSKIILQNSPPTEESAINLSVTTALSAFSRKIIYLMSKTLEILSFGRIYIGSSLWIIASLNQPAK
jgi:2-polyprenyl-3-methyl-5-hydroxy-6-metoxy-1,4-benzoquinol methylase